jgi:hypothetical protein
MSYRERRNRKDARGKTPEQIRRGFMRHETAYGEAIEQQTTMLSEQPGSHLTAEALKFALDQLWNNTRMPL